MEKGCCVLVPPLVNGLRIFSPIISIFSCITTTTILLCVIYHNFQFVLNLEFRNKQSNQPRPIHSLRRFISEVAHKHLCFSSFVQNNYLVNFHSLTQNNAKKQIKAKRKRSSSVCFRYVCQAFTCKRG